MGKYTYTVIDEKTRELLVDIGNEDIIVKDGFAVIISDAETGEIVTEVRADEKWAQ